jgi:RNA polymerase sigma-70 factor (ECF subfamily)
MDRFFVGTVFFSRVSQVATTRMSRNAEPYQPGNPVDRAPGIPDELGSGAVRRSFILFLHRCGVPREDHEDVLQDALVRAVVWLGNANYDPTRGTLRSWFLTVLRNRAIDYRRKRARSLQLTSSIEDAAQRASTVNTTSDFELAQLIQSLPESERLIVQLSLDGLTTSDIATCLGRSPGRTGALLASGKRRLRSVLSHNLSETVEPESGRPLRIPPTVKRSDA